MLNLLIKYKLLFLILITPLSVLTQDIFEIGDVKELIETDNENSKAKYYVRLPNDYFVPGFGLTNNNTYSGGVNFAFWFK